MIVRLKQSSIGIKENSLSKPLKTLHITTVDLTAWCFLRSWFRALRANDAEVTLACTVDRFRDDLEATGATVLHLPIARQISPLKDLASFLDLVYLIQRIAPDVVHTHTSKAGFLGRIAARLCGVPLVLHTIHELPENSTKSRLKKAIYWALEWFAARFAHHMVTVSEANYRQILGEHICGKRKLTLVREGLDLDLYKTTVAPSAIRSEFGIPTSATLIGSVGRLESAKGHADLIKAFQLVLAKRPDAYLVIVGHGQLREELELLIKQLDLEQRVILTGWREDMLNILGAFDYYALASHYEGLGIATMEAMAMRKPIVCTGVGGVVDVMVDGETGFLVPPHAPRAMADKLLELIDHPELAQRMSAAARKRVETTFQDKVTNEKLLAVYSRQLAQHGISWSPKAQEN